MLQEIAKAAKMKPTKFTYGPKEAILYALGGKLFVPDRKETTISSVIGNEIILANIRDYTATQISNSHY